MTDRQPTGKGHSLIRRSGSCRVVYSRAERSMKWRWTARSCKVYPFGFVMCRERNIKGLPRWVHQGLLLFITSGQQVSSSKSQSLRDFLPRASSRPCGVTLPWVLGPRRPWPVSATRHPTRQSSTWLFSASYRLHSPRGSLGLRTVVV